MREIRNAQPLESCLRSIGNIDRVGAQDEIEQLRRRGAAPVGGGIFQQGADQIFATGAVETGQSRCRPSGDEPCQSAEPVPIKVQKGRRPVEIAKDEETVGGLKGEVMVNKMGNTGGFGRGDQNVREFTE